MSTSLSNFREPVRVIIGDNDPDIQFRENAQLDAAMRTVLSLGKVVGDQGSVPNYAVGTDRASVTPDLDAATDPKAFAQLVYYTAKLFIVDLTSTAWRTRAFSEVVGENKEKIWNLLEELYDLENSGVQSSDYK